MGRARDVIQAGGRPGPTRLHLAGVGHEPDVHAMELRKLLDVGQHGGDVLGLGDVALSAVVQLIVGVDDQAPDAMPAGSTDVVGRALRRACEVQGDLGECLELACVILRERA